jgi:hypothetical protein
MSAKRRGKNWQATVRGPDGKEVTKTFPKRVQADQWETRMKNDRLRGSGWTLRPEQSSCPIGSRCITNVLLTGVRQLWPATVPCSIIGSFRPSATGPCPR